MTDFNEVRSLFNSTTITNLKNNVHLETSLIPALGLNNEALNEQPSELNDYFGAGLGLLIWQYPNQFSKYLKFISKYAKQINSYLEIGCRFGGTFIAHTEYLQRLNSSFRQSVAIDIIECPENLVSYQAFNNKVKFMEANSRTPEFATFINDSFFDLIFIDGDHSYPGVRNDGELTRPHCNIQVYHDITSDPCPGVGEYWNEIKQELKATHSFHEFVDQYDSVPGSYLGIGVAVAKEWKNS